MKISEIHQARERLSAYLKPSPLIETRGPALHEIFGTRKLFLKVETQQPTGSFKIRPALNGFLSQLDEARKKGVIASSSGNFAQAVAHAAALLGCDAQIVMTSDTSSLKIERTRKLGGSVVLCAPTFKDRWETTYRLQAESGRLLLHPYDSPETIAANGTLGLELDEQLPAGKFIALVPVSGGGLLAGVASAIREFRPDALIFGVQPSGNASMKKSLLAGAPTQASPFRSIADALVALQPGARAFSIIQKIVDDILLVSEEEIRSALNLLFNEQRLVVEPAGAVSLAAALQLARMQHRADLPVVCVLSGGNIAPGLISDILC